MGTIKILEGVEKNDGTKPMSEMEPLDVAEVVSLSLPGGYTTKVGDIVWRVAGCQFRAINLSRDSRNVTFEFASIESVIVRPLGPGESITIEISND
jgi:hypothetical protein